ALPRGSAWGSSFAPFATERGSGSRGASTRPRRRHDPTVCGLERDARAQRDVDLEAYVAHRPGFTHVTRNLGRTVWVSADARYFNGGETATDGIDDGNPQRFLALGRHSDDLLARQVAS